MDKHFYTPGASKYQLIGTHIPRPATIFTKTNQLYDVFAIIANTF